ncbi:putative ribonuclease H-like domain-containing protein [Tanacetum coccineum]
MRPFGCPVTILNTLDPLGKFDEKADEGFFFGYSINSKAFRVFNTRTRKVEENLQINFLENKPNVVGSGPNWLFDIDLLTNPMNYEPVQQSSKMHVADDAGKKTNEEPANEDERNGQEKEGGTSNIENDQNIVLLVNDCLVTVSARDLLIAGDLPTEPLILNLEDTVTSKSRGEQITKIIRTAYLLVFSLKMNPKRIEVIRLFLAYASFMEFIVYQMDVKSAFLYGTIEEEVYVCQPPSFEDPHFPNKVYKVEKALYGLHQAPRAWYETLSTYLLENGYIRGTIDKTLFIKKDIGGILLVQRYVDDIIFGSTKKSLCVEFEQMMHKRFQISSMGELTFFLGLQVQPKEDGIFISQDKYVANILKKFDFNTVKATSTPIETNKALNKDEEAGDMDVHLYRSMIGSLMYLTASRHDIIDSPFDLEAFSDSDSAGASLDRKSTTGCCQFLSKRLISWQCKKETIVANSTTEVE